jgi:sugar transferase (PEP-CTERM/EpsH1 system associated)
MKSQHHVPLIAHVIHRLHVGGLENGLVNLINRIPDDKYKHAIICLTDYTDFRNRINKDVDLFALHRKEGNDFSLYFKLWRLFRELKPEIVHTRNLAALEAQFPALLAGVPCRIHGEHGRDIPDLDGTSKKYQLLRKAFRSIVDRFIPLSLDLQEYLEEKVGVTAKKITHICNGVDIKKFHPASAGDKKIPELKNYNEDCIVIGTVGRMEAVKDQLTLAKAFIELMNSDNDRKNKLRLVMVGDGSLRDLVIQMMEDANLTEVCWFPGPRDDVPELLRTFDIFVLPSLAEGISNTILEAMASGLPIVATDVGGNSELIDEGNIGFLVPRDNPAAMAEAISRYVEEPEMRDQHAKNAQKRAAQEFSIDNMVSKYTCVYDEVRMEKGCA